MGIKRKKRGTIVTRSFAYRVQQHAASGGKLLKKFDQNFL